LCGGALPAGSATVNLVPQPVGIVEFVPFKLAEIQASARHGSLVEYQLDNAPPYGRMMLTLHCALLL
jgi:hypothetical protein